MDRRLVHYQVSTTSYHSSKSSKREELRTMSTVSSIPATSFLLFLCLLVLRQIEHAAAVAPLRLGFYVESCPEAELLVREAVRRAMAREARSAASVMRLQFHDCFVNGCDASLLLDDTPTMLGEKLSLSNINSLRSYDVIDEAKEAVERVCPGIVSCADIIVMASRDAVVLSGGPKWAVRLGRKDSLSASQEASDKIMPSPRANASFLINLFQEFNLSVTDLVALSGSHSIGMGRCFSIAFRLYNQSGTGRPDPHMDPRFRWKLDRLCPVAGDGNVTCGLDSTPKWFDNMYFKDLVREKGFLNSDQTLYSGDERTREVVKRFSIDQEAFFDAFVEGMLKMGDLQVDQPRAPTSDRPLDRAFHREKPRSKNTQSGSSRRDSKNIIGVRYNHLLQRESAEPDHRITAASTTFPITVTANPNPRISDRLRRTAKEEMKMSSTKKA